MTLVGRLPNNLPSALDVEMGVVEPFEGEDDRKAVEDMKRRKSISQAEDERHKEIQKLRTELDAAQLKLLKLEDESDETKNKLQQFEKERIDRRELVEAKIELQLKKLVNIV